ncbi:MAG: hypothetical protein U0235_28130 [Polyangiaceae bacterium]
MALHPIPQDLVEFVESGVAILVGTRDAALRPDAVRAWGVSVHPGRARATVFLGRDTAARASANAQENGAIAVCLSRPVDNFTLQLKGRAVEVRPATDADRAVVDRYAASYFEQLFMVGVTRGLTRRIRVWPATAVTFDITDIFVQTPGPGAGKRLEAR